MGKGGRYLKKKEKKKGRGWKIALIVLAVLLVLAGGVYFAGKSYLNSMWDKMGKAEIVDRGASVEDVMDAATYNPDKYTTPEE